METAYSQSPWNRDEEYAPEAYSDAVAKSLKRGTANKFDENIAETVERWAYSMDTGTLDALADTLVFLVDARATMCRYKTITEDDIPLNYYRI